MTARHSAPRRRGRNQGPTGRAGTAANKAGEERRGTPSEVFPAPRSFWWLPVAGQRHAVHEHDHAVATGVPVHTLCGATHDRPAPPTDAQWLWRTCEPCWNEACRIVETQ
ncbi:MAG: zinc finger protein [Pseudonocardiaceae bacterium]